MKGLKEPHDLIATESVVLSPAVALFYIKSNGHLTI